MLVEGDEDREAQRLSTTAHIYTHLDGMSMRATAQDMQNVFKQVDTAARKGQYMRKEDVLAANVLQFPKAAD